MSKQHMAETLARLITEGMCLKPSTPSESRQILVKLSDFINKEGAYISFLEDNKITIETFFFDPLLSIELEETNLHFIPITDTGWLDALLLVLKFIHLNNLEEKKRKDIENKQRKTAEDEFDWI